MEPHSGLSLLESKCAGPINLNSEASAGMDRYAWECVVLFGLKEEVDARLLWKDTKKSRRKQYVSYSSDIPQQRAGLAGAGRCTLTTVYDIQGIHTIMGSVT